ncbi:MAG: helix-turn-helix transcriptional regulator [Sphingomonadales bacterium]
MNEDDGLPKSGFVRIDDVVGPGKMFPFSRATLYRMIGRGEFPRPVPIGKRAVGFPVDEVRAKRDEARQAA